MGDTPPAITLDDVQQARERLRGQIYGSPCPKSLAFSRSLELTAYFKLENLQQTGSFKERGALNRLEALSPEERARGVVAASAGNHAQGVAYNARQLGIPAFIVMPVGTPLTKVKNTRSFEAEVVLKGSNYDEAFEFASEVAREQDRVLIHAFDDPRIIAGQGTIGLELLEQVPDLDAVVVPVGGGGLIGGVATAIKSLRPQVRVIGVQTEALPAMRQSLSAGEVVLLPPAITIADGIAVKRPGRLTFPLVQRYVDEVVIVSDQEIAAAILLLLEREKTLAEGAGAAALAAVHYRKVDLTGKRVVMLVSGGNIDMTFLSRVIERGLAHDGRLAELHIKIEDRPGSLAKLTSLLGVLQGNILQISHNRAFGHVNLGQTELSVSLETRGQDHVEEILTALREQGYAVER